MGLVSVRSFERQVSATSCVTACACMVLRARGELPDQRELHVDVTPGGRPLSDVFALLGFRGEVWVGTELVARVAQALAHEKTVIAQVHGPRWMELPAVARRLRAQGPIAEGWSFDGGTFEHVVVLYGLEEAHGGLMVEDELLCLDPYFADGDQPLRLTRDDLQRVGAMAIVVP